MATFLGKQSLCPLDVRNPNFFYGLIYVLMMFLVSGTGLFACQLAKNVFHARKVITTVSTAKIPKLKELLGEYIVDQGKVFRIIYPCQFGH